MINKTALKPGDKVVLPADVPDPGMLRMRVTVDYVDFGNAIADVSATVHPDDQNVWGDGETEWHTNEYPDQYEEW